MDIVSAASLPWLRGSCERLRAAAAALHLPHSLLISSAPGLGAELLGNWLAALLLCEAAAGRPCGACASCLLLRADSHPDYTAVSLGEDAQQIKIEQVRALIDALRLSAYRGGFKVGVIEAAETMNAAGANAFLKTLEEPTDRTLLMLIVKPAHRLPATIASRCMRVSLRPPAPEEAVAWLLAQSGTAAHDPKEQTTWEAALALTGGAPLEALKLPPVLVAELDRDMRSSLKALFDDSEDATLMAERWSKSAPGLRLAWLENWITRRVHSQLGGPAAAKTAERVGLSGALLKSKVRALFDVLDAARELRRLASTSLNQQSAFEAFLLMSNGISGIAKP